MDRVCWVLGTGCLGWREQWVEKRETNKIRPIANYDNLCVEWILSTAFKQRQVQNIVANTSGFLHPFSQCTQCFVFFNRLTLCHRFCLQVLHCVRLSCERFSSICSKVWRLFFATRRIYLLVLDAQWEYICIWFCSSTSI